MVRQYSSGFDEGTDQQCQDITQLQQLLDPASSAFTNGLPWFEAWQDFMCIDPFCTINNRESQNDVTHRSNPAFSLAGPAGIADRLDDFETLCPQVLSNNASQNIQADLVEIEAPDEGQYNTPQETIACKAPAALVEWQQLSQPRNRQRAPQRGSSVSILDSRQSNCSSSRPSFKKTYPVIRDIPLPFDDNDDHTYSENIIQPARKEKDLRRRNCKSAKKHRQKKKQTMESLIEKQLQERKLNEDLRGRVKMLRDELTHLRSQLLSHSKCTCKLIQSYINNQARQVIAASERANPRLIQKQPV